MLERWRWVGMIAQEVTVEKLVSIFTSNDGVESAEKAALAHTRKLAGSAISRSFF